MSSFVIPTAEDPFYTMQVPLEGTEYTFDFRYNQREAAWYFSLYLTDGTKLAEGIKIVCSKHLLKRSADVRIPPGTLIAFANGDDKSPPALNELGDKKRVTLWYFTKDEVFA